MKLFIAMPYGNEVGLLNHSDSETQRNIQFDDVWEGVIKPAVPPTWEAKRADELHKPGLIEQHYIERLLEADVLLADLTFSNPNVFYELGIRQALSRKSAVLIAQKGSILPFDVRNQAVIFYDYFHAPSLPKFHSDLIETLRAAATSPDSSPIHTFIPGLFVERYNTGKGPDEEIAELRDEIERLRASASIEQGTAVQFERRLTLRRELTNLLGRLIDTQINSTKLSRENANDASYVQGMQSVLNQQNSFLLSEATVLIKQIPDLVGMVEFLTLASAFANIPDMVRAEKYYRRAVNVATNSLDRSIAQRSFASFLFSHGALDEARSLYRDALGQLPKTSTISHQTNGYTLQGWAWNEALIARNSERAEQLFKQAQVEFEAIVNPVSRRGYLDGLTSMRRSANI